jgi:hypothetical protein
MVNHLTRRSTLELKSNLYLASLTYLPANRVDYNLRIIALTYMAHRLWKSSDVLAMYSDSNLINHEEKKPLAAEVVQLHCLIHDGLSIFWHQL